MIDVDPAVYHLAAAKLFHQLAGAQQRRFGVLRVKPLFITRGAFRAKPQLLCRAAHAGAEEVGRLEQNRVRVVLHFRIFTAHHTGHSDRLFRIANHEHGAVERAFFPVERHHFLTVRRAANIDLRAF